MDVQQLSHVSCSIGIFSLLERCSDQSAFFCDHFPLFLGSFTRPYGLNEFSQFHGHRDLGIAEFLLFVAETSQLGVL